MQMAPTDPQTNCPGRVGAATPTGAARGVMLGVAGQFNMTILGACTLGAIARARRQRATRFFLAVA